jgi:hypothetical protein
MDTSVGILRGSYPFWARISFSPAKDLANVLDDELFIFLLTRSAIIDLLFAAATFVGVFNMCQVLLVSAVHVADLTRILVL